MLLATIVTGCYAIALTAGILAQDRTPNYRGKVYTEIRIDNQGIILVDTAGNEVMIPIGSTGSDEGIVPPIPPLPTDADFNPDDYPVKISSIRKIGQEVIIEADEHVLGEVVAVGGDATIRGLVEGSVTATGTVRIVRGGIVIGNVIGNEVIEEQGAQVFGHITEQNMTLPDPAEKWRDSRAEDASTSAIVGISVLSGMFLFTLAVAMLFRRPTDRVKALYTQNILKTLLVGFLAWILCLPVFLLLCITIVGIPIAILGMPLAMIAAAFLGGAAFSLFLADFVKPKNGAVVESRFKKLAVGFAIGQIPSVGFFLGLVVDSEAMAIVCGIAALLLALLVATLGFGGAILTRFGGRDYRNEKLTVSVVVTDSTVT
ncbi:MAG: hypothetical protein WBP29_04655 [Candidatus Zixiibacteriota bacterium]